MGNRTHLAFAVSISLSSPVCEIPADADSAAGEGGRDTAAWVRAAGMKDFDTFRTRCWFALRSRSFQWPVGMDGVDLGFGPRISRPNPNDPKETYDGLLP